MAQEKNNGPYWWEKTVEAQFLLNTVKHNKNFEIKPLSGNAERAGDTIFSGFSDIDNCQFILIEFKKENNMSSEHEKYDAQKNAANGKKAYENAQKELYDIKTNRSLSSTITNSNHHWFVYGAIKSNKFIIKTKPYFPDPEPNKNSSVNIKLPDHYDTNNKFGLDHDSFIDYLEWISSKKVSTKSINCGHGFFNGSNKKALNDITSATMNLSQNNSLIFSDMNMTDRIVNLNIINNQSTINVLCIPNCENPKNTPKAYIIPLNDDYTLFSDEDLQTIINNSKNTIKSISNNQIFSDYDINESSKLRNIQQINKINFFVLIREIRKKLHIYSYPDIPVWKIQDEKWEKIDWDWKSLYSVLDEIGDHWDYLNTVEVEPLKNFLNMNKFDSMEYRSFSYNRTSEDLYSNQLICLSKLFKLSKMNTQNKKNLNIELMFNNIISKVYCSQSPKIKQALKQLEQEKEKLWGIG